jgi:hypothetical protein
MTIIGSPVDLLTNWIGGKYTPYKGREGIYLRRYKTINGVEYLWARWGYKRNTQFSLQPGAINWAFIYDGGRYWFMPGRTMDEADNRTLVDRQQHLSWRGIQK